MQPVSAHTNDIVHRQRVMRISACWTAVFSAALMIASSAHATDESSQLFHAAASVMQKHCISCHDAATHRGEFSLQTRESLMASEFVVPGDSQNSYLIQVVKSQNGKPPEMPKDAPALTQDEVHTLEKWIQAGGFWPAETRIEQPVVDDFDWWSFRPLSHVAVPSVDEAGAEWSDSPIDCFIAAQHRRRKLVPAPPAERRTLIRRLTYDLTGLPPTPKEVRDFVSSTDPDAVPRLIDRLLASPRYGERWARHWLDIVKYADTCGYDKDKLRPNAWPYRDYVIRSFNQDKPYTRFVQEQIAGDVLFPESPDGILGLGFLAAGPWDFIGHVEVPESKLDGMVARHLDRDEMVSNTLNTFCSVTIQCARCHNHKFDPFTQQHYYSLQAVFAAVDRAERVYDIDPRTQKRRQQLTAELNLIRRQLAEFDQAVRKQGGSQLTALEQQIERLRPAAAAVSKGPEYGYHSQIALSAAAVKWVEVDLGRDVAIDSIVLHPCHDEFNNINAGFGFPVRFRIELRGDAMPNKVIVPEAGDFTQADFPNPGVTPVVIKAQQTARVIRITATQLAERSRDFILALAEVEVFDAAHQNVAANAVVRALDSIEAPVRWRRVNLTDGLWPVATNADAAQQLAVAQRARQRILDSILTPQRISERQQLTLRQQTLTAELQKLPQGRVVYAAATDFRPQGNFKPTKGKPRTVRLLHRGDLKKPGPVMSPGTIPLSADDTWQFELPAEHSEQDRRAALARWITRRDNPLTWRSVANRIWQYHFGRGLVESPNDFGRMGQQPSHPELLDWLALEFRRTQSFKHLHRLILNSRTWQQSSDHHAQNARIDGSNRYLWRMNRRRLSAEEIRDTVLAVSGQLDLTMGGPGDYLFVLDKPEHSPHYEYHKFDPMKAARHRRSVYRFVVRSQPDPFMTTLDCADSSQSTPKRTETQTALQALSLLNNRFNLVMAQRFADQLAASQTPAQTAFEQLTGRLPDATEEKLLTNYAKRFGMPNLCRMLFNLNEFVFID